MHPDLVASLPYAIHAFATVGEKKYIAFKIDKVTSLTIDSTIAHVGIHMEEFPIQQEITITGILGDMREIESVQPNSITWDDILNGVNKKEE